MANTTVEVKVPTGLTLTVDIYPYGSDAIANGAGDTLTEATNRKGLYTATVTEALSGWYTAHIKTATTTLGVFDLYLEDDTGIWRTHDAPIMLHDGNRKLAGIDGTKNTLDDLNDVTTAQVNTEVDTALTDINLDHLLAVSVTGADVIDNSVIAKLVSKEATADWDDFVNTTDSLQALRDNGDSAWITATGFSTHNAADVWTSATRTVTAATNITSDGTAITLSSAGVVGTVNVVNTTTTNSDMRGTDSAFLAASAPTNFGDLAITVTTGKVTVGTNDDKAGYSISGTLTTLDALENISAATVNTQVDTALTDIGLDHLVSAAVTGVDVTNDSIIAKIVSANAVAADWDDFVNTTDSLQAIRDRGDTDWATATGFSTLVAADVANAVWDAARASHTTSSTFGEGVLVQSLNANARAQVNTEADTALTDYDPPTNTEMAAAFTEIKGATWSAATDTLEALRDRGDAAWITATGFSTHNAAAVWTSTTRTITAATNITSDGSAITMSSSGVVGTVNLVNTTTTNTDMVTEPPTAIQNADALLIRNVSNIEATAPEHSLCTVVLASLESSVSGTTMTIKRTDGSTTHATKTVTVDASAAPITGIN